LTSDSDRSDLVGMDKDAELLVVELKRGYVDMSVLTQALNYASQYAPKSSEELIQLFIENSSRQTVTPLRVRATSEEEASRLMADLTGAAEINESQVILLVGTAFDPRVLTMCEYVNKAAGSDATLSVECWKVSLFNDGGAMYLQLVQVVPTPDLRQEVEQLKEERRATKYKRNVHKLAFMYLLKEKARAASLQIGAKPGASYHCSVSSGGLPPIEVEIYSDPALRIPGGNLYRTGTLPPERLEQDGQAVLYRCSTIAWEDESARERVVEELINVVKAVQLEGQSK
jgi:hypothetical protein